MNQIKTRPQTQTAAPLLRMSNSTRKQKGLKVQTQEHRYKSRGTLDPVMASGEMKTDERTYAVSVYAPIWWYSVVHVDARNMREARQKVMTKEVLSKLEHWEPIKTKFELDDMKVTDISRNEEEEE